MRRLNYHDFRMIHKFEGVFVWLNGIEVDFYEKRSFFIEKHVEFMLSDAGLSCSYF